MIKRPASIAPDHASALELWSRLSPGSARLIEICAVLLVIMLAAINFTMWDMRVVTLRDASHHASELATAIAEQTARSIQGVDLVLQSTQESIEDAGVTTPAQFRTLLSSKNMFRSLQQEDRGLPQASAFVAIGADGTLLNTSRRWPTPPVSMADRDYFQYLSQHDSATPYITAPLQNRVDHSWTFYVIRRVDSPTGQFLGLVLGAVDLNYFTGFYQSVAAGDHLDVYLLNDAGLVLTSYPFSSSIGTNVIPQGSRWFSVVSAGKPDIQRGGGLNQMPRLTAIHPLQDFPLVVNVSMAEFAALKTWRIEMEVAAAGSAIAVLCMFLLLRALALQLQRLETSQASLTERNAALVIVEEENRYLAHHDDLTKLVNRRIFRRLLDDAVAVAGCTLGSLAVFYLDLDRFKQVNDTKGHLIGDQLLKQVAERLHDAVSDGDVVARTGGDEFAIIQALGEDPAGMPAALAEAVLAAMRPPFFIDGNECRIGITIGIAQYPDHAVTASHLLRNADTALFQAKAAGRGTFRVFDATMVSRQDELSQLERELRIALQQQQFELDYQPIAACTSRRVMGCEALLRWRHPLRGLVLPDEFIAVSERSGQIIEIGYWVFETACAEAASWPEDTWITVNLSPVQFTDDELTARLTAILRRTGLRADRLTLEVTEGLLIEDAGRVINVMHGLRALGVRFSLDDFGTGHSGFGYLRQFPFDGIKIDKLFVRDMVDQPEARAIVSALLTVSAALNIDVVAEGVETSEQLEALCALNCTYIQGYFTGRPQSAGKVRAIMGSRELSSV